MSEGVDLFGLYNTVTDWRAVRNSGIEFAWVKLSDGNTNRDDYGYVAAGRGVGIVMGGYHYAQPGDPVAQANRLIDRCIAYGALELAPALDLESPFVPDQYAINFSVAFLKQVQARGHVPVLYANNSMLSGVLGPIRQTVPAVRVWGASYGAALTVPHDVHQYTSSGRVPGIVGNVDRNTGVILRNSKGAPQVELTDKVRMPNWNGTDTPDNTKTVNSVFAEDNIRVAQIKDAVDVLSAKVASLQTGGVDVNALAAQVAALVVSKMQITVTSKP